MPKVYAYRLKPSNHDRVATLLADNQIAIGWSDADVVDRGLTKREVREEIKACYGYEEGGAKLTKSTNQVWRFIEELRPGDIILVPDAGDVHFLRIAGPAVYLDHKAHEDTAIRRMVERVLPSPAARAGLPEEIRDRLYFRGPSVDLEPVKDEVLAFLKLDLQVVAAEDRAVERTRLLLEALGPYRRTATEERLVERRHAEVFRALVEHLESRQIQVANTRFSGLAPDLFTLEDQDPSLFEIKIGVGAGDYLKGAGQLLVYEKLLGKAYRKFLVVPSGIQPFAKNLLAELGIGLVEFAESDRSWTFDWKGRQPAPVEATTLSAGAG